MAITTQEVIEALQEEGLSDDVIKTLVPILAYESRVDGVPYVLTALDSESPSYGLGQANVTTMESALWMALSETGVDIPGATDQQVAQWKRAGYDVSEEDVRDFTEEQEAFVIDYLNNADLQFHAKVVKHMLHQKELESDMTEDEAIQDLYKLTIAKFNQPEQHPEAASFKLTIEDDVDSFYTTGPTTTTTTTMPTTTTTTMPTTTTTEPQDTEIDTTSRSAGITNQFGTPPQDREYKSQSEYQMIKFLTDSVNKKREQNNLPRLSIADRINKKMERPVGPITSKLRQGVDFIEDDIQEFRDNIEMPFGRPVNIEDVLNLLEP